MSYFLSPKVIFGQGALKRLASELEGKGSKAVVITDRTMARFCDGLVEIVKNAGYDVKVWDGAEQDPAIEVAIAGSKALLDFNPQWVIGFGGGSAIDTAKAAWVLYERPEFANEPLNKAVGPKAKLNLRQKARFAAVPTTSGTGADVTWVAVLTDTAKNRKIVLAHNDMVPDISVLDPELTLGMPKALTASTGLDVLGHSIDGFTARQRTDFSDGLCLQAMKLTFEWLPKACRDGNDFTAREKMQNAATIAGLGFGNSSTGLSHALAHSLGAFFHLPHGRGVGIALPYTLKFIATHPPLPKAPNPVERLSVAAGFVGLKGKSDLEVVEAFIRKVRELAQEIEEPLTLEQAGVTEKQMRDGLDSLVQLATKDPNMYTVPCECKEDDLRRLFEAMWEGKVS